MEFLHGHPQYIQIFTDYLCFCKIGCGVGGGVKSVERKLVGRVGKGGL